MLAGSNSAMIPAAQQLTSSAEVTPRATGSTLITNFVNQETGEKIADSKTVEFASGEAMSFEAAPKYPGLVLDVNTSTIGASDNGLLNFVQWAEIINTNYGEGTVEDANDVIDFFNNGEPQHLDDGITISVNVLLSNGSKCVQWTKFGHH